MSDFGVKWVRALDERDLEQMKKEIDSARKDVCEALAMLSSRHEARVQYEEEMQFLVRACATLRNIKV